MTTDAQPQVAELADAQQRIDALTERVRFEREVTGRKEPWVPSPGEGAYNVIIIGGGQAGLGAAFALQRKGIDKVKVLEAGNPDQVGCWDKFARMHTLRSPKHMKGIELDVPSLHVQCWFTAKYGEDAWNETTLVPRLDWNEYLTWYRHATEADVDFGTFVTEVLPPNEDGNFVVKTADGEYLARRVIFSLGLDGGGGTFTPDFIKMLPEGTWAHTEDDIDFAALAGKRVAVLGGGASGFDNAAAALEAGAGQVDVHMRRSSVPDHNSLRWMEFPGMQEHFFDLTDEQKWDFTSFNGGLPQPPTQASIWRAFEHDNFALVMESVWDSVEAAGDTLMITNSKGETFEADFIISATGYAVDLSLRPELEHFLEDIQLWQDVFEPSQGHGMGKLPYLGDGFQFQTHEGGPDYIGRLTHLSTGARLSHGVAGNQLSGIYAGISRIANRIATDITREAWPGLFAEFKDFYHQEITSVGKHKEGEAPYAHSPRYPAQ